MRERKNHLVLVSLIMAALVGVGLLAIPGSPFHKGATLGLDLQGGLEVVLEAVPPKGHTLTDEDLDRSVDIMRNRIDKLGVSEPEIRKQGDNQIVIQLAGVTDPAKAAALIGKTATLELFDLEQDLIGPSTGSEGAVATESLFELLGGKSGSVPENASAYYLFSKNGKLLAGPEQTRDALFTRRIPRVPPGGKVLGVARDAVVVSCIGSEEQACPPGLTTGGPYYYLFRYQPDDAENPIPEMTGAHLKSSGTRHDFDQFGQPIVRMEFTGEGENRFQDITRRLWQRGNFRGTAQHFAIVLDRELQSWPQIDPTDPTLSDGISGGSAQIESIGTLGEAKDLALVLQTGALPVSFVQVERTDVSATLGKDSLQEAKTAAMIGLLVVALFLIVFYRLLGLVAVTGLAIYVAFMYAAILILNVTLTLPGFAGLILTIGVAADANVVIFERIKEEVRSGKSTRAAIATGYQKGFHTIVDANVVTAITALVLFAVATAQVKGFALMLLVGTVVSVLTAVVATRAMLGLLAGFRWFENPNFMGAKGQAIASWQRIDVCSPRRRRIWLSIATVAIVASVLLVFVKGLNFGIDFKGGTQITFRTPEPVSLSDVRTQMGSIGRGDAVVQGRGSSQGGERYTSFQVRTKSLTQQQQNELSGNLRNNIGATSSSVKNVSSSFSRQIAKGAIYAVVVSFILIMIYISLRFQWRFAVPILRTLFSDILITVGFYALSGREVTTATVAAILTVLGYSIYDTIIVFDRVRENIPLMRRASFATIANVSLWETMRRSLATTFITLLPIASLLLFGGETLKDFAFALFVGIGLGAFSTFFVATPFLTVLMERSPEFRGRVGVDVMEKGVGGGVAVEELEAEEEEPEAAPAAREPAGALAGAPPADGGAPRQSKREQRRQRRRSRPHGRAR
jgi:SecD/SecF fusion protein